MASAVSTWLLPSDTECRHPVSADPASVGRHPAKKHLLNPVIRPQRWCEGTYLEPYTTMYDDEEKRFKLWARAGSDAKAGYVGGNAAWMLYFTSSDGVHWERPFLDRC
jgi:hypothetical protein